MFCALFAFAPVCTNPEGNCAGTYILLGCKVVGGESQDAVYTISTRRSLLATSHLLPDGNIGGVLLSVDVDCEGVDALPLRVDLRLDLVLLVLCRLLLDLRRERCGVSESRRRSLSCMSR